LRKNAWRYLVIAIALAFCTIVNSQGFASDQWFRLNPDEHERIIHSTEELPSLWVKELHHDINDESLAKLLQGDHVKEHRFHDRKVLLIVEHQGIWPKSKIYISRGRILERATFAKFESTGALGVSDHLWFVEVDAKNNLLTSKVCSDVGDMGCAKNTYKYNGVYFMLEKIESQMKLDGPWIPAWTATKIVPPK
jgi:hypothetical protein